MEERLDFVQLRIPGTHLLLGAATRAPGRSADALVESLVREPLEPVFRVWAVVRGLQDPELKRLAADVSARYAGPVRHEEARLSFDVRPHDLPDALFGILLAFQSSFGPVWMHFAQGRLTMRARAVDCTEQECAVRMRQALRLAQVRRQVRVVTLRQEELSAWHGLQDFARDDAPAPPPSQASMDALPG